MKALELARPNLPQKAVKPTSTAPTVVKGGGGASKAASKNKPEVASDDDDVDDAPRPVTAPGKLGAGSAAAGKGKGKVNNGAGVAAATVGKKVGCHSFMED